MKDSSHTKARRAFLIGGLTLPGAAAALPSGAQAQQTGPDGRYKSQLRKRTREEVKYQNEPYLGRTCSREALYQGDGVCVILDGAVSPDAWCNQWVPNTMG